MKFFIAMSLLYFTVLNVHASWLEEVTELAVELHNSDTTQKLRMVSIDKISDINNKISIRIDFNNSADINTDCEILKNRYIANQFESSCTRFDIPNWIFVSVFIPLTESDRLGEFFDVLSTFETIEKEDLARMKSSERLASIFSNTSTSASLRQNALESLFEIYTPLFVESHTVDIPSQFSNANSGPLMQNQDPYLPSESEYNSWSVSVYGDLHRSNQPLPSAYIPSPVSFTSIPLGTDSVIYLNGVAFQH